MSYLFGGTPFDGYARDGRRSLNMGGGGSSGPTNTTTQTSNIPDWLRPQVEAAIGAGTQQVFNVDSQGNLTGFKPYVPYSTRPQDYVSGFSPMQEQAFKSAANLQTPSQFGYASDLSSAAGAGGLGSARQAMNYGATGAGYGAMGAQVGQQALGYGASAAEAGRRGELVAQQYAAQAAGQGNRYGAAAASLAPQAQAYGQTAADIGKMGLEAQAYGRDVGEQARDYAAQAAGAGQQYAMQATSPGAVQAYMSPYQQAATDVQKREAQRAFDIQTQARKGAAARSGAYGGARQAIEQAEAERNLNTQLQNIQATGDQAAYDRAIQSLQFGSNVGLQGLQGAQTGLGTALQGGQLGLSGIGQAIAGQQAGTAALGQAGNLYGVGIQGAGLGVQSGQLALAGSGQNIQGQQAGMQGVQGALAGTAQGMQGAQAGLAGVQGAQAGYGLANTAAGQLGNLGSQQLAAQQGIIGLQNQLGGQQQQYQQSLINQAINNYAMAQQYPQQNLAFYNSLIRGYATPTITTSNYQASPNPVSQLAGLGLTGAAAYGMMNKKNGGMIKSGDGLEELGMYRAMKGE